MAFGVGRRCSSGDDLWWRFFAGEWEGLARVAGDDETHDNMQVQLTVFHLTGIVAAYQGDFDRARSSSQAAADLLAGTSKANEVAQLRVNRGLIEGLAGRLELGAGRSSKRRAEHDPPRIAWYQSGRFALWLADRQGFIAAIDGLRRSGIFDGWTRAMIATLKAGSSGFDGKLSMKLVPTTATPCDCGARWGAAPTVPLALFDWAMLLGIATTRPGPRRGSSGRATALGMAPLLARLDARQGVPEPATAAGPGQPRSAAATRRETRHGLCSNGAADIGLEARGLRRTSTRRWT